jgi:hypothetical protein
MTNEINASNEAAKYPAARPEITAEIIALDCQLADLILRCQGNARELDELAGMLDAHLACCEFERDSLMGLVGGSSQPALLNLTDLPADQQRLIFESVLFGGVTLKTLQMLSHADIEYLIKELSRGVQTIAGEMTEKEITEGLQRYLEMHRQNLSKLAFYSSIQPNNN